jgi:hypothetical protein
MEGDVGARETHGRTGEIGGEVVGRGPCVELRFAKGVFKYVGTPALVREPQRCNPVESAQTGDSAACDTFGTSADVRLSTGAGLPVRNTCCRLWDEKVRTFLDKRRFGLF